MGTGYACMWRSAAAAAAAWCCAAILNTRPLFQIIPQIFGPFSSSLQTGEEAGGLSTI